MILATPPSGATNCRAATLERLGALAMLPGATEDEVLALIGSESLPGTGVGSVAAPCSPVVGCGPEPCSGHATRAAEGSRPPGGVGGEAPGKDRLSLRRLHQVAARLRLAAAWD